MDTAANIKAWIADLFEGTVPSVHPMDGVEIIIIAIFFYYILVWIKNTRAWMLLRGILVVVVFFIIAGILQMSTILWLGDKLLSVVLVAIVVVFQPELRHALETIGRTNLLKSLITMGFGKNRDDRFSDKTVTELVRASFDMGAVKTGALIVVEKDVQLTEYERTGIPVDAVLTRQLLINIFEKNTPLHDGAIIVRGDRVVSATCYLPLTDNLDLSKDLGTRHRAAVGISEVSDSLTIVVSEESGKVSVAQDGKLIHDLSEEELTAKLIALQHPEGAGKRAAKAFEGRNGNGEEAHQ